MERYDVVIVGGGPAGLFAARELENEFKVLLIEKKEKMGDDGNRIVNKKVFKKLKVDKDAVIQELDIINFYSPSGLKISTGEDGGVRGYSTNKEYIQKDIFEQLVNTKTLLKTEVKRVNFLDNSVETNRGIYWFKTLLAADGCSSVAREQINYGRPVMVNCYTEVWANLEGITTTIISNDFAHGFYGWIMPLGKNIEAGVGSYMSTNNNFNKMIKEFPLFQKYKNHQIIKRGGGTIPTSLIRKKVFGSCVFIGDSTGGEPMMGGSIHKAIDETMIVCDILKKDDFIEKYDTEWNKLFLDDFVEQQKIRHKLDAMKNGEIDELFKHKRQIESEGLITGLFKALINEGKNKEGE